MLTTFTGLFACVVVWALWSQLNKRILKDFFSPFNLLLYFWVLPFVSSFMYLSNLQAGLSLEALFLIIICTMALTATSLWPALVLKDKPLQIIYTRSSLDLIDRGGWLIGVFFVITLAALYGAEFYNRNIPLFKYLSFEATSATLHTAGKDSKLQIIAYGIYVVVTLAFFVGINSRRMRLKVIYFGMVVLVALLAILKASKSDMFITLISCFALLYYHYKARGKHIPKSWLLVVPILVVLVVSMTAIRVQGIGHQGGYAGEIEFKYTSYLGVTLSEVVSIIYGYMALGFQNLSNYMEHGGTDFRIGTSLFRPLLSALMQGDLIDSMSAPVRETYVISDAANVGTYLRGLYIEGGIIFCLLGSIIYGILVNAIYLKFRKMKGGMWMFVYVGVIFPWVWLFFTNAFSVLTTYTNLIYIIAFFILLRASTRLTIFNEPR